MVSNHRVTRRAAALTSVALCAGATLGGCSSPESASDLPTPDVVWTQGEPSGEVWESEWADLYVEARVQLSAARAYGDYSDPDLIAAMGYDNAASWAATGPEDRFDTTSSNYKFFEFDGTYAFWGEIVAIDVADDAQSAVVYGCEVAFQGVDDTLIAVPDSALIRLTPDGGVEVDSPGDAAHPGGCSDAQVWEATWATPIDLTDVGRDEVKMPLPREYYIDLGVISE